jgi:hypothetical protein
MAAKRTPIAVIAVLVGLSAFYDFYRGYSHEKSIGEGGLAVMLGFVLLAGFWWLFSN